MKRAWATRPVPPGARTPEAAGHRPGQSPRNLQPQSRHSEGRGFAMNAHVRSLSWGFKKAPLGRVEAAEDLAGKTEELWADSPGAGGQWEGADQGEALRPCRRKRGSQGRAPWGGKRAAFRPPQPLALPRLGPHTRPISHACGRACSRLRGLVGTCSEETTLGLFRN